jgi:hypothetical protein
MCQPLKRTKLMANPHPKAQTGRKHPLEIDEGHPLANMRGRAIIPSSVKTLFWRTKDWTLAMKKELVASRSNGRRRLFWNTPGYAWRVKYELLARNLRLTAGDCVDWEYAFCRLVYFTAQCETNDSAIDQALLWWGALRRCRKWARCNRMEYHDAVKSCKPLVAAILKLKELNGNPD